MADDKNVDRIVNAPLRMRGHDFEDFTVGMVMDHHWGRTIQPSDNVAFSTSTLHFNPIYFNVEKAKAAGHSGLVANPMLVFATVFGLSTEDNSEHGGAFLGMDELTFHKQVMVGDTVNSRSTVHAIRESKSDMNFGIVTWHTEGFNQKGERVVDFKRTNLVARRKN